MKLVLLNSGGKDSLAVAMTERRKGDELHSLYVSLGHTNDAASRRMAKRIAERYCASHAEESISGLWPTPTRNGLKGIAFQAMLLHAYAAAWGATRGISAVASGQTGIVGVFIRNEMPRLVDAHSQFREPMEFRVPLAGLAPDMVYPIVEEEPLWRETVTCNESPPCGTCAKCELRAKWLAR